jgi:RNA polymerase sigma factor (sigma-70 family)
MDDSRDLNRTQFEDLLQNLDADRERAGVAYEQIRRKLIKFFECNSCPCPEDLVDETFNRVARRLADDKVGDVAAFAWGVAKNVVLEARRKNRKMVSISELPKGENSLPGEQDPANEIQENIESEKKTRCLHICMQRLGSGERKLFLAYYNAPADRTEYRQRLAQSWGLTIGSLRVRVNRLRNALETCVRKCTSSWGGAVLRNSSRAN